MRTWFTVGGTVKLCGPHPGKISKGHRASLYRRPSPSTTPHCAIYDPCCVFRPSSLCMHFTVCVWTAVGEDVLQQMPRGRDRSRTQARALTPPPGSQITVFRWLSPSPDGSLLSPDTRRPCDPAKHLIDLYFRVRTCLRKLAQSKKRRENWIASPLFIAASFQLLAKLNVTNWKGGKNMAVRVGIAIIWLRVWPLNWVKTFGNVLCFLGVISLEDAYDSCFHDSF